MASLGGLMRKKASVRRGVTEEYLLSKESPITPEEVLSLAKPTTQFMCKTTANTFGIEFTAFKLRDLDHGITLFETAQPADMPYVPPSEDDDDSGRFVRYDFTPQFFELDTIGATVTFRVGSKPVKNFRMIERHYFRNKLLKSFDFEFGFCIPDSTNTCEHIYQFPKLSRADVQEMVDHPYETKSDSFYFVDNELVMHHKAEYAYHAGQSA
eukprot:m.80689 g.80689  ORF g.80689 m.80689 type:complete len:211 (-) comp12607_c1_seq1:162-794(-)